MKYILYTLGLILSTLLLAGSIPSSDASNRRPHHTKPPATSTPTPIITPSPTPILTPSPTPVVTPSPVITPSPTVAPTPTPVITPSPTPVVTPSPTPSPTPNPCSLTATFDSTGATDVTAAMQSFIQNAVVGSTICFKANATYLVNGQVHLTNRGTVTLLGNNALVKQTTRNTSPIFLIDQGGGGILFKDFTIRGANPRPGKWEYAYEHNHAIAIGGVVGAEFSNLNIINVGGDGFYLGGGAGRWADSISIHNSLFDGIGRMGIALTDGISNSTITNNTFKNIGYYLFDIEPNGVQVGGRLAGAEHIKILDNAIGPKPYGDYPTDNTQACGFAFVVTNASGGGVANDIEIARNTITDAIYPNFRWNTFGSGYAGINVHDNLNQVVWGNCPSLTSIKVTSITALLTALADNTVNDIVVTNGTYHVSKAALQASDSLWIGSRFVGRTNPVTVRAETTGGVTFDGGGVTTFGGISFEDGSHDQTWQGFNFANGEATDTGVIVFGGYAGLPAAHHITLKNITLQPTLTSHTAVGYSNDHGVYFSWSLGGNHDILIDGLTVIATATNSRALDSAIHFYHSDSSNLNAHDVIIRNTKITGTDQAIIIWDSSLRNILIDGATIDGADVGVRYENAGQGITLKNIVTTNSITKGFYSSLGTTPPGITFINDSFDVPTGQIYGTGLEADSKDNRSIGLAANLATGLRFVSSGGTISQVAINQRFGTDGAGYSGGTGGTIRLSIQAQINGLPSGIMLGSATFAANNPHSNTERQGWIPLSATIPAGVYFLVIENIDPNPSINYMSANQLTVLETHAIPDQPSIIDGINLAVFERRNGVWALYKNTSSDGIPAYAPYHNTAVMDIAYSDGHHEGNGYAALIVDYYALIKGADKARQTITFTNSHVVSSASVRVKHLDGTGSLTLTLYNGSTAIATGTVSAATIPLSTSPISSSGGLHWDINSLAGGRWATINFSAVTLQAGVTYSLQLSSDSATTYLVIPLRETLEQTTPVWGAKMFKEGGAQKTSGTTWSALYDYAPVDLQFYLK